MSLFKPEHGERLPTVRLHKAILQNFKSVGYGEVVFDCNKQFVPFDTTADVLGIYGQNGSGKTAFIEALSILKSLLSGERILFLYADCIAAGADHAELEFTFDLQYPTEPIKVRKVVYSFCLAVYEATELSKCESEMAEAFDGLFSKQVIRRKVRVYNEMLKIGGEIDGENKKVLPAIDTSTEAIAFGPSTKRKLFYEVNKENNVKLLVNKHLASERSTSFIFMNDTLELFSQQEMHSTYLAVVDTKSMAAIRSNVMLPLYTLKTWDDGMINTIGTNIVSDAMLEELKAVVDPIGEVLPQFVPGMSISIEELGPAMLDDGREGKSVELVVKRGDKKLPVRCESDGVRKIISVMSLIITAYNQRSTTIAIDELDAGIFEYLLGDLLQIFAESGKGQLIFTSHNLRPLEVLDKKFICFTTTNPNNRYIHMKNVGASNNLRNLYFREIQMNEQDEEVYKATKKHKIIAALRKAGM
ncbi:MAG: AAA family ATPase [Acinetobacter sp.]